jgi:hypothetical protein
MLEVLTGWKIGVEVADLLGPYIIVSPQEVGTMCKVLAEHGVPHVVEGAVPSRRHADTPFEIIVRLGLATEAEKVQEILDSTP